MPLGVLYLMLLFAAQIVRLIGQAMLHRTIRIAMKTDPASVAALIAKLDGRKPWGDALAGWVLTGAGIALAIASCLGPVESRVDTRTAALVLSIVGLFVLGFAWWTERQRGRSV